ncbi:MAG: DUF1508 domain-containing protein [Saprospiraceae bacterium]|nr:DUF1508 domain-containing protein [Saprospiraceae bacterium]
MKIEIIYHHRKYHFLIKAGNGRILIRSVGFDSRQQCVQYATILKKSEPDGSRFERKKVDQRLQLVVRDVDDQILATGHHYSSNATFNHGVRTIISLVREAEIVTHDFSESR